MRCRRAREVDMTGSRIGVRAVVLLQFIQLAGPPDTYAQAPQLSCKPSDDVGVVHGTVSKEGEMQIDHGVVLTGPVDCMARTDSSGYFRFEYVPVGSRLLPARLAFVGAGPLTGATSEPFGVETKEPLGSRGEAVRGNV